MRSVVSILVVVVLPAPFGPKQAEQLPFLNLKRDITPRRRSPSRPLDHADVTAVKSVGCVQPGEGKIL
jgi:hypothetical protein